MGRAWNRDAHLAGGLNVPLYDIVDSSTVFNFFSWWGGSGAPPSCVELFFVMLSVHELWLRLKILLERLRDKQWEHYRGVRVHLHWCRLRSYLTPAHGLVRLGPAVASVELLRRC